MWLCAWMLCECKSANQYEARVYVQKQFVLAVPGTAWAAEARGGWCGCRTRGCVGGVATAHAVEGVMAGEVNMSEARLGGVNLEHKVSR